MKATIKTWRSYPIELREIPLNDGGGWVARIPELGRRLFKGVGDTPTEALTSLEEIATPLFEELRRKGLVLPEPPLDVPECSGRLVLRVPRSVHARLAEEARDEGMSLNTYLVAILSDSLRSPHAMNLLKQIRDESKAIHRTFDMQFDHSISAVKVCISDEDNQVPAEWSVIQGCARRAL